MQKFLREFESVIDKHKLPSFEKFVYLKKRLGGDPEIIINSLDVTEQFYEIARQLLIDAFDSELTSKYNLIQKMAELKLPDDAEPYTFIGEMRTVISGVETMSITKDEILQYFIWHALNEKFRSKLISITNKSKPSLEEIKTNIFEAKNRYVKLIENCKERGETKSKFKTGSTTSMAVNIDAKSDAKIICVLCDNDGNRADHYMISCTKYDNPKKKIDKLKTMNGCTKCSFRNHSAQNCRFKFKSNCRTCNGQHMSYLCMQQRSNSVNAAPVTSDPVAASDSSVEEASEAEET